MANPLHGLHPQNTVRMRGLKAFWIRSFSFAGAGGPGSQGSGAVWSGAPVPWGAVRRHEEEGGPCPGHHQGQ